MYNLHCMFPLFLYFFPECRQIDTHQREQENPQPYTRPIISANVQQRPQFVWTVKRLELPTHKFRKVYSIHSCLSKFSFLGCFIFICIFQLTIIYPLVPWNVAIYPRFLLILEKLLISNIRNHGNVTNNPPGQSEFHFRNHFWLTRAGSGSSN